MFAVFLKKLYQCGYGSGAIGHLPHVLKKNLVLDKEHAGMLTNLIAWKKLRDRQYIYPIPSVFGTCGLFLELPSYELLWPLRLRALFCSSDPTEQGSGCFYCSMKQGACSHTVHVGAEGAEWIHQQRLTDAYVRGWILHIFLLSL